MIFWVLLGHRPYFYLSLIPVTFTTLIFYKCFIHQGLFNRSHRPATRPYFELAKIQQIISGSFILTPTASFVHYKDTWKTCQTVCIKYDHRLQSMTSNRDFSAHSSLHAVGWTHIVLFVLFMKRTLCVRTRAHLKFPQFAR